MNRESQVGPYDLAHQLSENADIRIVGSLARQAHMGVVLDDLRLDGTMRNLNVMHTIPNNYLRYGNSRQVCNEVPISTQMDRWIRRDENGTTSLCYPNDPDSIRIEVPEADELFAATRVNVGKFCIQTVAPEVLARIDRCMYVKRRKHTQPYQEFSNFLTNQSTSSTFPERFFQPFDDFQDLMQKQYLYRVKSSFKDYYNIIASPSVRERIDASRRFAWAMSLPATEPSTYVPPNDGEPDHGN